MPTPSTTNERPRRSLLLLAMPDCGVPTLRINSDAAPLGPPHSEPLPTDAELDAFQRRLLSAAGSDSDDWNPVSSDWLASPAVALLAVELRDLLRRQRGPLSVYQHPQIARLLPLWQQALQKSGLDTVYLTAITRPQHYVDAMQGRLPAWQARLQWLRHLLDSEAGSRGQSRRLLAIDAPEFDWREPLDALNRDWRLTGLSLAKPGEAAMDSGAFAGTEPADATTDAVIEQWCGHAWAAYQALCEQHDDAAQQQLDTVRAAFDAACSLMGGLLRRQLLTHRPLMRRCAQAEAEVRRLNADLERDEAEIDRLDQGDQQQREQFDATLLRLNAVQTSAAWLSAKPVHWLEQRRPALVRALVQSPRTVPAALKGRLGALRRRRAVTAEVLGSGLFDPSYYILHNPAVVIAGQDPLQHWLDSGWRQGLAPHPLFDTGWYLRQHPSLADGDHNPISHYLQAPPEQPTQASVLFDPVWYREQYPDTADNGLDPLVHYLRVGAAEGLNPSPLFDQHWYLQQSADVVASGANPLLHYLEHGAAAGRDPCPLFSSAWYLQRYPDVAAAGLNPLAHFLEIGAAQDRDPGPLFDTAWYRRRHPAIDADGINPLAHYLSIGSRDGLAPSPGAEAAPTLEQDDAVATLDNSYTLTRTLPVWDGDWSRLPLPLSRTSPDAPLKVLVVDERHPTPDLDSGSYRMRAILDGLLDMGAELVFVGDQAPMAPRYVSELEALGIRCLTGRKAALRELISQGNSYHSAILSRPGVCERYLPLVRAYAPGARLLYDTVDLHWVRLERGARIAANPDPVWRSARRYRRIELSNARAADITIAITDDERQALLQADPALNIGVIPNIHQPVAEAPPFDDRRDLFFLGAYGHAPNVEAARFMVEQVLPKVIEAIPDIRLQLVGSAMPDSIAALASEHVVAVGFTEDVRPFFEQSRVFVAPLLHGAGMKGKVGQSLSLGLPVVTTRIGAEGIGLQDGDSALIADDAAGLAERIIRCYQDPALWQQLSLEGRKLIGERFSPAAVRRQLAALVLEPLAEPDNANGARQ